MPQQSWFALYSFTQNFERGILTGSVWVRYPVWVHQPRLEATVKDTDWGRFPAHNKPPFSRHSPETQSTCWLVQGGHVTQSRWVPPPPRPLEFSNGNLGERISISGGGLFGCEFPGAVSMQVCSLGEQSLHADSSKTEQSASRKSFSAESRGCEIGNNSFNHQKSKHTKSAIH